jgi:hypothetical protein
MKEARKHSHHRFTETSRHSLRDGFTAYSALSPVIGLSCHRHRPNCFARLDVSVETSGPHDFAIRSTRALVSCAPPRPSHPRPCVRDDRDTPLVKGRDGGGNWSDLGETRSKIFLLAVRTDGITLIGFDNLAFIEKPQAEPNHPISGSKP